MSGIFNWLIEGLKLMRSEGLQQPQSVKNATNQYREDSDTVGMFVRECLAHKPGAKIKTKDVYSEYKEWCDEFGYSSLNQGNLIQELRNKNLVKRDAILGNILFDYEIKDCSGTHNKSFLIFDDIPEIINNTVVENKVVNLPKRIKK